MIRFEFKLSYRNEVAYRVWGSPDSTEIEEYHPLGWLEETEKKYFNGDATEYEREIVGRICGVCNRTGSYRMPEELYRAFVSWKVETHNAQVQNILAHPELYGEYKPSETMIPRPIYWENGWNTEPYYAKELEAVAA